MRTCMIICAGIVLSFWDRKEMKVCAQPPMPYVQVREADVMWSKRIWRVIDLREKINFPLYYPLDELPERIPLFRVIQKGIQNGKITKVYDFDIFSNEFGQLLSSSDALNRMTEPINARDTVGEPLIDPMGNMIIVQDTLRPDRIAQYWIKEDWFFDKLRSVMDVRIMGLAPVIEVSDPSSGRFGYKALFWLYFPDCRNYFSEHKAYNPYNDAAWLNFDQLFAKRIFSSYIRMESNVFNRPISSYAQGQEALLESERIKESIFNFEQDLWHYEGRKMELGTWKRVNTILRVLFITSRKYAKNS